MKSGRIFLFSFVLFMIAFCCQGQEIKTLCVEKHRISIPNIQIFINTDKLLSEMPTPIRISNCRNEPFLLIDTNNKCVEHLQPVRILCFKNISYRDANGLASPYWISLKNKHFSVIIEGHVLDHTYTLSDFQRSFLYDEENVFFLDKTKHLTCQENPRKYYTCTCIPICNSQWNEHLVFYFNKKNKICYVLLYLINQTDS